MQINYHGGSHVINGDAIMEGFVPFNSRIHEKEIAYVNGAIGLIAAISINIEICSNCFKALPNKRSLADILQDPKVNINYIGIPENKKSSILNSLAMQVGNDIGITALAFYKAFAGNDARYIASVLLHEMAHVNGATMNDMQAEDILIPCGFKIYYDENAHG